MDNDPSKRHKSKKKKSSSSRASREHGNELSSTSDAVVPVRSSSRSEDSAKPPVTRGNGNANQPIESLTQMEQDALAKARASAGLNSGDVAGVQRISSSGATSMSSSGVARTTAHQLEADRIIKNQARGSATTNSSFAWAHAVQNSLAPHSKRIDSVDGRESVGGASEYGALESRSSLRNLEDAVAAKTRAASTEQRSNNNELSRSSRLQQMEDDIVAKTRARSFVNDQSQPMRADSTQRSSLRHLEDEVAAKHRAQRSSFASSTSSRGMGATTPLKDSLHDADDALSPNEFNDEDENKKKIESQSGQRPGPDGHFDGFGESQYDRNRRTLHQVAPQPQQYEFQQDGATQESQFGTLQASADLNTDGIEAFVADPEVVDATGVALVLSDAEEEQLERKRIRRIIACGLFAFFALAAGIVAAVVLTVGKPQQTPEAVPTSAPSTFPSMVPSASPTTTRLDQSLEALLPISLEEDLANRTSPQYQAALWIADEDELQLEIATARFIQRYILAVFYFSLGGDNWEQCGRFDTLCGGDIDDNAWLFGNETECSWLGVECDISGTDVVSIFFVRQLGNNLIGTLPQELLHLTQLSALLLNRNQLDQTLPAFLGDIKKLQALSLIGCGFQGTIPEKLLSGASLLGTIYFGENMFTGTIPTIAGLLPLRTLDLSTNGMSGNIPSELGKLTELTFLELQDNSFSGPVPVALSNLDSLQRLYLQNNSLTGTLRFQAGKWLNLEQLQLGYNKIKGSIPLELYNMTSLSDFRFESNQLTGQLSSSIRFLNRTLRRVVLADNKMTGPLPITAIETLGNLHELILHGNDFTGTITKAICDSKNLGMFFDLRNLTVSPRVNCSVDPGCCDLIE